MRRKHEDSILHFPTATYGAVEGETEDCRLLHHQHVARCELGLQVEGWGSGGDAGGGPVNGAMRVSRRGSGGEGGSLSLSLPPRPSPPLRQRLRPLLRCLQLFALLPLPPLPRRLPDLSLGSIFNNRVWIRRDRKGLGRRVVRWTRLPLFLFCLAQAALNLYLAYFAFMVIFASSQSLR